MGSSPQRDPGRLLPVRVTKAAFRPLHYISGTNLPIQFGRTVHNAAINSCMSSKLAGQSLDAVGKVFP